MRFFLLVGLVLFGTAAYGDQMAWKLEKGAQFFMAEFMKQEQVITIDAFEQKVNSTQSTVTRVDVEEVRTDGSVDLAIEITDISSTSDGLAVQDDVNKKMIGARFEFTLDSEFEVTRFEGYDDFVKRLVGDDPQLDATFRAILSEVSCRQLITQSFSIVPNKEVRKGGKWQQSLSMSLGPFGGVDIVRDYEHAGREVPQGGKEEFVKINLSGAAVYRPPDKNAVGLPFKITGGELDFKEFEGSGYYDADKGQLRNMAVSLELAGTLSITMQGQDQEVHLKQHQVYVIDVSDEDPGAKEK